METVYQRCLKTELPVLVLIPDTVENDRLAEFLEVRKIPYFRGSELNVLNRFARAIESLPKTPEFIVRITSDCPFVSPDLIKLAVNFHQKASCDYTKFDPIVSGLDVEVYKPEALVAQDKKTETTEWMREHVKVSGSVNAIRKLSLDTKEDYLSFTE